MLYAKKKNFYELAALAVGLLLWVMQQSCLAAGVSLTRVCQAAEHIYNKQGREFSCC